MSNEAGIPFYEQAYRNVQQYLIEHDLLSSNMVLYDSEKGFLLMGVASVCLGMQLSQQMNKGERLYATKFTAALAFAYFLGLTMTIKETVLFGVYNYIAYNTVVLAGGLLCAFMTTFLFRPLFRRAISLGYSVSKLREAFLMILVKDYGFPENAKEFAFLFAKKRVLRYYVIVRDTALPLLAKFKEVSWPYIKETRVLCGKARNTLSITLVMLIDRAKEFQRKIMAV